MRQKKMVLAVMLAATTGMKAQTTIDIGVKQYPPLHVTAETVSVELPTEGITLGSDLTVEGGDGNYTYSWTLTDGTEIGTEETLSVYQPGDYYLTVADGQQCQVSTLFTATATSGIGTATTTKGSITVADGHALIQASKTIAQIRIADIDGRLAVRRMLPIPSATTSIPLTGLGGGIFLLCCIYTDGHADVHRIIIPNTHP